MCDHQNVVQKMFITVGVYRRRTFRFRVENHTLYAKYSAIIVALDRIIDEDTMDLIQAIFGNTDNIVHRTLSF